MALDYGFCLDELEKEYTSTQFSEAVHALIGDGLTKQGAQFSATVNGFSATLASGYALAAGRWLKSDEPQTLQFPVSSNNTDRVDALAVHVDYEARTGTLAVLENVNPEAIRENLGVIRNAAGYNLILYFVRIRRGATTLSPEDVTDVRSEDALCGAITPLSEISEKVLYIYAFLTGGIDRAVQRILDLGKAVEKKAEDTITELDEAITRKRGVAVGDVIVSLSQPLPAQEWLLCNGGSVPAEYAALRTMLGGTLPNVRRADGRFQGYIYAGAPYRGSL